MFIPLYDHNPSDPMFYPYVTRLLVAANVLVFVFLQSTLIFPVTHAAIAAFAIVPSAVSGKVPSEVGGLPPYFTFVTYMFLHGSWLHLLGNMLFLWVFGDNVEHAMGRARFLVFYLLCGIAGGYAHFLSMPDSDIPLVGASAAIAGIVAAYLMLFPYAKVWVLFLMRIPLRLSAIWVLGSWIVFQFVNVVVRFDEHTAWWAHVGGILAGALLVIFLRRPDIPLFARDVRRIADVR